MPPAFDCSVQSSRILFSIGKIHGFTMLIGSFSTYKLPFLPHACLDETAEEFDRTLCCELDTTSNCFLNALNYDTNMKSLALLTVLSVRVANARSQWREIPCSVSHIGVSIVSLLKLMYDPPSPLGSYVRGVVT